MNVFRVLGDVSHTASKCILIWAIHRNKSAEGVSLLTQILYVAVFVTRYLDLFWVPPTRSWWNFILKNFYIWSSIYIIMIMTRVFARTREREKAWKLGVYVAVGSLVSAPLISLIFNGWSGSTFVEVLWTFSIILESVCVLPQLILLRQTTVPTVIDSFYLVTLGSYRAFYVLNWIYRAFTSFPPDPISVIFGVVQTAFYADFAWVYWTRQRVKLRGGAVVDSDDYSKGFLINRVIRHGRQSVDEDLETGDEQANGDAGQTAPPTNRWGARGVSVSADDTLQEHDKRNKPTQGPTSQMEDSFEDADVFADGDHDDDAPDIGDPSNQVLNSDEEWRSAPSSR